MGRRRWKMDGPPEPETRCDRRQKAKHESFFVFFFFLFSFFPPKTKNLNIKNQPAKSEFLLLFSQRWIFRIAGLEKSLTRTHKHTRKKTFKPGGVLWCFFSHLLIVESRKSRNTLIFFCFVFVFLFSFQGWPYIYKTNLFFSLSLLSLYSNFLIPALRRLTGEDGNREKREIAMKLKFFSRFSLLHLTSISHIFKKLMMMSTPSIVSAKSNASVQFRMILIQFLSIFRFVVEEGLH